MTPDPATSAWRAAQVAGIAAQTGWALPAIDPAGLRSVGDGLVVWDMWQLADAAGATVRRDGESLWFFLAAPRVDDPDARHDRARIHLVTHGPDGWRDHGPALPDGWTPGSREWSGSARLVADRVELHFTAAGGADRPRFTQRLFACTGRLAWPAGEPPMIADWSPPTETVRADGHWYRAADQAAAVADRIKGFRDPGLFRDPADGRDYLLFTGSAGWVEAVDDGVIGLAVREGDRWQPLPPPVSALDTNSELERAHIVHHQGRYLLFWSTQAKRFAPAAAAGVTGLYAMVADSIAGPWRPANGTGLVAGNPPAAPDQAYCWWVTGELEVASFVDFPGTGRDPAKPGAGFGGVPAPLFQLRVDGDRISIAA